MHGRKRGRFLSLLILFANCDSWFLNGKDDEHVRQVSDSFFLNHITLCLSNCLSPSFPA
ncbi:hypothetical protein AAHE18_13G242400 [Arachis hypogaea]